jgi:CDGSH-type Zn-finger protein
MYQDQPVEKELEAGNYYWCSCGKSRTAPFCDGSHKGTGMEPLAFEVKEKKKVWICACGRTKTPPFCDGAHQKK